MDTKLEYVYAVYQEKSVVKAAEKLFISQPSLSITIKRLEQNLGITIFDRSSKPLELTDSGRAFIEYIEQTKLLEEKLLEKISDIEQLNVGFMRIGCPSYIMLSLLPHVIQKLHMDYPGIKVDLCEDRSPALRQRLLNGEMDIVIDSFACTDAALDSRLLLREALVLIVPSSVARAEKYRPYLLYQTALGDCAGKVSYLPTEYVQELIQEPLVSFRPGTDLRMRTNSILAQYDIRDDVLFEFEQVSTCISYVEEGLGCSVVPITPFLYGKRHFDVGVFLIRTDCGVRTQKLIWKKDKYRSKAVERFIETALQCFGEENDATL